MRDNIALITVGYEPDEISCPLTDYQSLNKCLSSNLDPESRTHAKRMKYLLDLMQTKTAMFHRYNDFDDNSIPNAESQRRDNKTAYGALTLAEIDAYLGDFKLITEQRIVDLDFSTPVAYPRVCFYFATQQNIQYDRFYFVQFQNWAVYSVFAALLVACLLLLLAVKIAPNTTQQTQIRTERVLNIFFEICVGIILCTYSSWLRAEFSGIRREMKPFEDLYQLANLIEHHEYQLLATDPGSAWFMTLNISGSGANVALAKALGTKPPVHIDEAQSCEMLPNNPRMILKSKRASVQNYAHECYNLLTEVCPDSLPAPPYGYAFRKGVRHLVERASRAADNIIQHDMLEEKLVQLRLQQHKSQQMVQVDDIASISLSIVRYVFVLFVVSICFCGTSFVVEWVVFTRSMSR